MIVQGVITFVITGVVVQFLCSTDVKTIVKIVLVYTFFKIAIVACLVFGLVALSGD